MSLYIQICASLISLICSQFIRYKDVQLPDRFIDVSHFVIFLSFEGITRPLLVPNPLLLRRKFCNIWPFEVKQALGLMGNMQVFMCSVYML